MRRVIILLLAVMGCRKETLPEFCYNNEQIQCIGKNNMRMFNVKDIDMETPAIEITPDGGFITSTYSPGFPGEREGLLIRWDKDGNIIWYKHMKDDSYRFSGIYKVKGDKYLVDNWAGGNFWEVDLQGNITQTSIPGAHSDEYAYNESVSGWDRIVTIYVADSLRLCLRAYDVESYTRLWVACDTVYKTEPKPGLTVFKHREGFVGAGPARDDNDDAFLMFKMDSTGRLLWSRFVNIGLSLKVSVGIEAYDGNIFLFDQTGTMMKFDSVGNLLWHKRTVDYFPDGTAMSGVYSLSYTPDGKYMAIGNPDYNFTNCISALKFDDDGNVYFARLYCLVDGGMGYPVYSKTTTDGYIVVSGLCFFRGDENRYNHYICVFKIDKYGNVVWE